MKNSFLYLSFFLVGIAFLNSCNNNPNVEQAAENDTVAVVSDNSKKSFVYTKYELPLSVDVYKFLNEKNIAFSKEYMNGLDKKDKYFTSVSRALVLGIYSSDLAYATIYDKSQESVDYFSVSIDLAHKLDIEKGYNSKVLDRAYDNINNNDSLSEIAAEAYLKTCNSLEENNTLNILPFIVLGSWLESVHILTQASLGSLPEDGLFEELYNQKEHLVGMINYLNDAVKASQNTSEQNEMKTLLEKLKQLQAKYNKINASDPGKPGIDQFKDIIFLINEMRQQIIA